MTMMKARRRTPEELLAAAPAMLQRIDSAPIFRSCPPRPLPPFQKRELKSGDVLGEGRCCQVREIKRINAARQIDYFPNSVGLLDDLRESINLTGAYENLQASLLAGDSGHSSSTGTKDVNDIRQQMSRRCLRKGYARYAIKSLRPQGSSEYDRVRARIDLAIEVKYLSSLHHPNIVKIRGVLQTDDVLDPDYLFVMDRLYDTLDKRIGDWAEEHKQTKKLFGLVRIGEDRKIVGQLLIKRLTVAYDLTSALKYMHKLKVVHRDINADNIGFDVRDNVKIFDFGFATSLFSSAKVKLGLYRLTERTGTFPYMAPEVAKSEPYNEKCDVFSFGILLWEMLSLKSAFETIDDKKEFYEKVSLGGLRPEINQRWPEKVRQFLMEAFKEVEERSDMGRAYALIQEALDGICNECGVVDRPQFLREQSDKSLHTGMTNLRKKASFLRSHRFGRASRA